MKRVFKIGEVVFFEDDYMRGWGKVGLINRTDKYPELPCSDDSGDILTIIKDDGGEIETTPNCVYQVAQDKFFRGEPICWEHHNESDYPFYCPAEDENCFYFELDD